MTFRHPLSACSYTSERNHCVCGRAQGFFDIRFPSCNLAHIPNTRVMGTAFKCKIFLVVVCCVQLFLGFQKCVLPLMCDAKLKPVPVGMPKKQGIVDL